MPWISRPFLNCFFAVLEEIWPLILWPWVQMSSFLHIIHNPKFPFKTVYNYYYVVRHTCTIYYKSVVAHRSLILLRSLVQDRKYCKSNTFCSKDQCRSVDRCLPFPDEEEQYSHLLNNQDIILLEGLHFQSLLHCNYRLQGTKKKWNTQCKYCKVIRDPSS